MQRGRRRAARRFGDWLRDHGTHGVIGAKRETLSLWSMQQADGLRTLRVLLLLAVPLSLVHYTDNYLAFDLYPPGEFVGLEVTRDSVWIGWLVFTAGGGAGAVRFVGGGG